MSISIIIIIIVISLIQSIFGVGVLLFGTPIFLALNFSFVEAISMLLPLSLLINLIQVIPDRKEIDYNFHMKLLFFSIPFIIITLYAVISYNININLYVGLLLIIFSFNNISTSIKNISNKVIGNNFIFFPLLGIIHGISNLGGSLLTLGVHEKNYSKEKARSTIAICYGTLALGQLLVLIYSSSVIFELKASILYSCILGLITYLISENFIYKTIDETKYRLFMSVFLFLLGFFIVIKSLIANYLL